MTFAQVHFPFEHKEWFEHHYPGDFIVEYNGQTRGWFYTMHVLATALLDRPAFRTCLAHAILRGGDRIVTEKGIREGVRQALLPLWNSYYFLALYANAEGIEGKIRTDS